MKKVIYCECGWAGSPQQLETSETVNNEESRVCPRCGSDMLPPAVAVSDEEFSKIMEKQRKELIDREEEQDEDR
jgi:hypothetical protein